MTVRRSTTRKPNVERAALLTLITRANRASDPETALDELAGLVTAAGAEVVLRAMQERSTPDPATVFGKGKAEEMRRLSTGQGVVVIEHTCHPRRRQPDGYWPRVIDRTELILDISRCWRAREGKLQFELARCVPVARLVDQRALSRWRRDWTRVPGETHSKRTVDASGIDPVPNVTSPK